MARRNTSWLGLLFKIYPQDFNVKSDWVSTVRSLGCWEIVDDSCFLKGGSQPHRAMWACRWVTWGSTRFSQKAEGDEEAWPILGKASWGEGRAQDWLVWKGQQALVCRHDLSLSVTRPWVDLEQGKYWLEIWELLKSGALGYGL